MKIQNKIEILEKIFACKLIRHPTYIDGWYKNRNVHITISKKICTISINKNISNDILQLLNNHNNHILIIECPKSTSRSIINFLFIDDFKNIEI